jgi:hypothetical protein
MSIPVFVLAALLSYPAAAGVENQNHCWQDSGKSGPKVWGRYDYHLVNRCDQTIHVWDAIVFWQNDGTEERWSCGHGKATRDEIQQSGCRPLKVRRGGTVSYSTRSGERYWWFACYPDNVECNELGKEWADAIHGMERSLDPGEVARRMGLRSE